MADYASGVMSQVKLEENSCGIKKILDVKITDDGKQMYKVKWEPTWEPAENLVTCQHLIDEFWSFVNIAKVNRENTPSVNSYPSINSAEKIPKLAVEDKSGIQQLIARTSQTSASKPTLVLPNLMKNQHKQFSDQKPIKFQSPTKNNKDDSIQESKMKEFVSMSKDTGHAKYALLRNCIENFNSPYVKIILVCKVCNKEQSLKLSRTWREHYLTHASNEDKPHKCPYCDKAFIKPVRLRQHLKTHENAVHTNVKEEDSVQVIL